MAAFVSSCESRMANVKGAVPLWMKSGMAIYQREHRADITAQSADVRYSHMNDIFSDAAARTR